MKYLFSSKDIEVRNEFCKVIIFDFSKMYLKVFR